ncbi:ATP-binding cassette subfamily C protein CydD [Frondihabitans sp. PhB188]|uniref:thiol reductant ABC exporter subunit CydD n=1 Tax=Frondihabitans sp. PhB188 TaxID=2485200 RepID=UPI000F481F29|nr:thiol reductant ABC exporter subunit CydD [Frondihabitans sp. PhB188]ROQ41218.1 ATP-binding cassette subfamily C protein CydD [Frondihabitans sp. PhB188]
MKPLDPRLLRYARSVRGFLGLGAVLGVVQTIATVAFAFFVSRAVVSVVDGHADRLPGYLVGIGITVVVRSVLIWGLESLATRTAVRVKSELRGQVVDAVVRRGGGWVAKTGSARLATLTGPGLDALDDYFAKYVPQLILTALATPILVVVMFSQDLLSGIIVVVTLPLIPVFMVLIGWTTRSAQARQWDRLAKLASSFLDAVSGLSTLKVFGRERRQVRRIGDITDEYRRETMKVLQVSFLSGFALEMAASLSVAIVAVTIGIRLVEGSMLLPLGLFLLLLTPEAYLPLRQVGAHFHAAADGVAAAEEVFAVLEEPNGGRAVPAPPASSAVPSAGSAVGAVGLEVRGLSVAYEGRSVFDGVDLDVPIGEITAIAGPSGVGKSSLVAALLGTVEFDGTVRWAGAASGAPSPADVAWSGQRPGLMRGTVASNVALGAALDRDAVRAALDTAAGSDVDLDAVIDAGGAGLSGGQAQRVALARAIYRVRQLGARLLLVDEPTSALDSETELLLVAGLRSVAASGVAVLVVTHRPAVAAAADRVLTLTSAGLVEQGRTAGVSA